METIIGLVQELAPGQNISPDGELVRSGVLDSILVTTLALELAGEFGVRIGPGDLREENFATPRAMAELVARLKG